MPSRRFCPASRARLSCSHAGSATRTTGHHHARRRPFRWQRGGVAKDHKHRLRTVKPYSYANATTLLSNRKRALLAQIADTQPSSLHELAITSVRTPGNLSHTLKTMERYGLVRPHQGERGKSAPRCLAATCSWQ